MTVSTAPRRSPFAGLGLFGPPARAWRLLPLPRIPRDEQRISLPPPPPLRTAAGFDLLTALGREIRGR
ncbi:hypothetical protein [Desulfohalovibrio reitneri]|uniref:hypothetical protein n=1 Tax=Desulfohalovibrio reitneri TaxID=1307759 RepID=UPI0004A6E46E|nr:hypothetical protein [Desulfohalovibrio reitneri]